MSSSSNTTQSSSSLSANGLSLLDQGDQRWEARPAVWRERTPAFRWPEQLLEAFSQRMSQHGLTVSRPLMLTDRGYALEQLVEAQLVDDEELQSMSIQLFRHFEDEHPGSTSVH